jgi:hypothetical protein
VKLSSLQGVVIVWYVVIGALLCLGGAGSRFTRGEDLAGDGRRDLTRGDEFWRGEKSHLSL